MIWLTCKCGWIGIAANEFEAKSMHTICDPVMSRRFAQNRMASDGVAVLVSESRWRKLA